MRFFVLTFLISLCSTTYASSPLGDCQNFMMDNNLWAKKQIVLQREIFGALFPDREEQHTNAFPEYFYALSTSTVIGEELERKLDSSQANDRLDILLLWEKQDQLLSNARPVPLAPHYQWTSWRGTLSELSKLVRLVHSSDKLPGLNWVDLRSERSETHAFKHARSLSESAKNRGFFSAPGDLRHAKEWLAAWKKNRTTATEKAEARAKRDAARIHAWLDSYLDNRARGDE